MADESEDGKPSDAGKSGGGIVSWAVLAVVCAASSFGVVFFLAPDGKTESAICTVVAEATPDVNPLAREDQEYVELKELLITIGNEPATRYVKINASIVTKKCSHHDLR